MQAQRKALNYEGERIYIGIDVHLKSWVVSVMTEHTDYHVFSQPPEASALSSYLHRNFPGGEYYSAYEAGFSGVWIHYQLLSLGIHNIVVNPADIPTKQKEKVRKRDSVDAKKIARTLRSGDLTCIYIPSQASLADRSLGRLRLAVVRDLTRMKLRAKSMLYYYGVQYPGRFKNASTHWGARFQSWIREEVVQHPAIGKDALLLQAKEIELQRGFLAEVTREIRELSQSEKYAGNIGLLRSIPGIGLITSFMLMTEMENVSRFKNSDHLAGFIGLIPDCHDSGENEPKLGMTFRGQKHLRTLLIECAWVAIGKDAELGFCYNKYCKRMEPNKAVVRVARKLINRIYFVLKQQREYEPLVRKQKEPL